MDHVEFPPWHIHRVTRSAQASFGFGVVFEFKRLPCNDFEGHIGQKGWGRLEFLLGYMRPIDVLKERVLFDLVYAVLVPQA